VTGERKPGANGFARLPSDYFHRALHACVYARFFLIPVIKHYHTSDRFVGRQAISPYYVYRACFSIASLQRIKCT
jgi:hypothetical protein